MMVKSMIIATLLLLVLLVPVAATRVISSQTLTIYAYIPERTNITVNEFGETVLETNYGEDHARVSIMDVDNGWRILSVTAR
jgi:hypothetical protein